MPEEKEKGWFDKYLSKPLTITGIILGVITGILTIGGIGYSVGVAHRSLQCEDERNSREITYQTQLQNQITNCEKEKQAVKDKEIDELRKAYDVLSKKLDDQLNKSGK